MLPEAYNENLDGLPGCRAKVEAHIYSQGGHAFNMGLRSNLITLQTCRSA
ncbi:MAG: hypothetical protein R3C61_16620 [Bacteroidia bacterium]